MTTAALLGVSISTLGLDAALAACRARIAAGQGGYACFVNVHTLTESTRDRALRDALAGATFCFADGMPLVWLARALGTPIAGRVCGPDFMAALLAAERDRVHGFLGGAPGRGEVIAGRFGVRAAVHAPPMRAFSPARAAEDWEALLACSPGGRPPEIIWVGLGAPKQERWLHEVSRRAPGSLLFGVGAAFDFLSGATPRAPELLQRAGLEWAFRLATEPRRLWRRYLATNTRFAVLAGRAILSGRSS